MLLLGIDSVAEALTFRLVSTVVPSLEPAAGGDGALLAGPWRAFSVLGDRAHLKDDAPQVNERFYRVVAN